jgi:hypothetical protein
VFTGDDVAEEFGVNKSSYEAVELPKIKAYQAREAAIRSAACMCTPCCVLTRQMRTAHAQLMRAGAVQRTGRAR